MLKKHNLSDFGKDTFQISFYGNRFRKFVRWPNIISLSTFSPKEKNRNSKEDQKFLSERLQVYGFFAEAFVETCWLTIKAKRRTIACNVEIFIFKDSSWDELVVLEIQDIRVGGKYRSRGVGSQLLQHIEKRARNIGVNYIVGDLQRDTPSEPLEARKKFFKRNGFVVIKTEKSKFSGYIIKKDIYIK